MREAPQILQENQAGYGGNPSLQQPKDGAWGRDVARREEEGSIASVPEPSSTQGGMTPSPAAARGRQIRPHHASRGNPRTRGGAPALLQRPGPASADSAQHGVWDPRAGGGAGTCTRDLPRRLGDTGARHCPGGWGRWKSWRGSRTRGMRTETVGRTVLSASPGAGGRRRNSPRHPGEPPTHGQPHQGVSTLWPGDR